MSDQKIQQKVKELESIMLQYRQELSILDKDLFQAVSDYQKALDEERLKEIKQSLNI